MAENKKISQFTLTGVEKGTYIIPILDGNTNKIVAWQTLKDVAVSEAVSQAQSNVLLTNYYDTGWVENLLNGGVSPDWTNVHLSASGTSEGNITHGLNCGLERLLIKVLISTDGTDANSVEGNVYNFTGTSREAGYTTFYVDANNIKINTMVNGFGYSDDSGNRVILTNDAYYYRIIVVKLF